MDKNEILLTLAKNILEANEALSKAQGGLVGNISMITNEDLKDPKIKAKLDDEEAEMEREYPGAKEKWAKKLKERNAAEAKAKAAKKAENAIV
jgi:hypothetical protein